MNFNAELFFAALGLALVLEGLLWALFPAGLRQAMALLLSRPVQEVRFAGLALLGAGLIVVWLALA